MIYLDNSATTRSFDEASAAVLHYMKEEYFNAASAYGVALAVDKKIVRARELLARTLGAESDEVYYTSGGTESNNMAILGILRMLREKGRFITSAAEHPSVFEVYRALEQSGQDVVVLGVGSDGLIRMDELEQALTPDTVMVSLIHVNNEVGAVEPLGDIAALMRKRAPQAVLHADGVQAYMRLAGPADCDIYSLSGHKIHAPKGVGALMVKKHVKMGPGLIGGGQEMGMRSGTTNTPGIMGLHAAVQQWQRNAETFREHLRRCKLRLARNLLQGVSDCAINGPAPEGGAPHILNMSFMGVRGEVLLHALETRDVYISTGSACSARKQGNNRILQAMGIKGERAVGAVRMSLSVFNSQEDMDRAAQYIAECVGELRRYRRR